MGQDSPNFQNKETVSIRLSNDIVESMDDALFYAKKEFARNKGTRLTKSDFYELILREIISEYKLKDAESALWKSVLMWSRK